MRRALGVLLLTCLTACQPKFQPKGSLSIDGAAFEPSTCQVLAGRTAIELMDAKRARLQLSLPPTNLPAFKDVSGTPTVRYLAPDDHETELGACGSLTLTGEGYHGSGKRALSGHASLACVGSPKVEGDLSFTGCF